MTRGEKIRYLRKTLEMNQEELANKIGVSFGLISKYEKDEVDIPSQNLKSIAQILNTSMDYLEGLTDDPRPLKEIVQTSVRLAASTRRILDLSEISKNDADSIQNLYNSLVNNKNKEA